MCFLAFPMCRGLVSTFHGCDAIWAVVIDVGKAELVDGMVTRQEMQPVVDRC